MACLTDQGRAPVECREHLVGLRGRKVEDQPRDPGVVGQLVSVQFPQHDSDIRATVLDSQPIVVDGNVRHQLRLRHVDGTPDESSIDDFMDGDVAQ